MQKYAEEKERNLPFHFLLPPMSRPRVLEPLTESEKEGYQDIANVYERVCALLTDLKINRNVIF